MTPLITWQTVRHRWRNKWVIAHRPLQTQNPLMRIGPAWPAHLGALFLANDHSAALTPAKRGSGPYRPRQLFRGGAGAQPPGQRSGTTGAFIGAGRRDFKP